MTENTVGNVRTVVKTISALPSSGRYLIEDFAQLLGYEIEYFRKQVRNDPNVRTITWGSMIVIDAEWYWEDLIRCRKNDEATVKGPSSRKRTEDTESRSPGGKTGKGHAKPE